MLPSYQRGFTLIEVLIALSIIAVVSVVALPNFKRFSANQDINGAATNVINILRKAQSDANSGIRCSDNVGVAPNDVPRPSFSFDVNFKAASIAESQLCVNNTATPPQLLDFTAPPKLDPKPVFSGTAITYNDSNHIFPSNASATKLGNPLADYTSTCPSGAGSVSFRNSQVYWSCNPSVTPYVLLTNSGPTAPPDCATLAVPPVKGVYCMVMHDDRNSSPTSADISTDVVVTISPSGVIGVIQ